MDITTVVLYSAVIFAISLAVSAIPPMLKSKGTHMHMLL